MVKSVKSSVPLLRLVIELTLPNSNGKQHEVFAEAAGHAKGFYTKGAPAKIGNNAMARTRTRTLPVHRAYFKKYLSCVISGCLLHLGTIARSFLFYLALLQLLSRLYGN